MNAIGLILLFQAAALLGFLTATLAAILQLPLHIGLTRSAEARFSRHFWFGWALLPALAGAAVWLFALLYGIASGLGWEYDHCIIHPGHPHICLRHIIDTRPAGPLIWMPLLLACGGVAWQLWLALRHWRRIREWRSIAVVQRVGGGIVYLLPVDVPAAFTVGAFTPQVFWTRGLLNLLDRDERRIVLHHEWAHQRNRDPRHILLLACCRRWLPGGRMVVGTWLRRTEVHCDRACVLAGCDPRAVASTILKVQRAAGGPLAASPAMAYANEDARCLKTRVGELLSATGKPRIGAWPLSALLALSIALLLFGASTAHHSMETLLGWLSS